MYCDGSGCALIRCKRRKEVPEKLDKYRRYWWQDAHKQVCFEPLKEDKRLRNGG